MKVSRRKFTGILGGVLAAIGVGAKTGTPEAIILTPPQTVSSGVVLKSSITGSTFITMPSYSGAYSSRGLYSSRGFRISAEALHDLDETSDFPKMYFIKESE